MSNVETFSQCFYINQWFDQDLSDWDVSSVKNFELAFAGANWAPNSYNPHGYAGHFNNGGQAGIANWDVSNCTRFVSMFQANTGFNQPIGSWGMSSATQLFYMFQDASGFDQNLGSWDVTSVTNATNFMKGVTLSTANYQSLLNGWGPQNVNNNVNINFGNSQYSSNYWRNHLVNSHGWTITDGGQA